LETGHTHAGLDQVFGLLAHAMKSMDVLVSAEDVQLPYGKLRDALPWFACMCCEFCDAVNNL
jgi:hypothetical protein